MAKKISDKELNNVSGGCGGDNGKVNNDQYSNQSISYTCHNKSCKKTFTFHDAVVKVNIIYCPYCGTEVGRVD